MSLNQNRWIHTCRSPPSLAGRSPGCLLGGLQHPSLPMGEQSSSAVVVPHRPGLRGDRAHGHVLLLSVGGRGVRNPPGCQQ